MSADHVLYRFFDTAGDLLYIGITNDPGRRWGRHAGDKPWWNEVDRIELERHPDRPTVLLAERDAIKAEYPRYNVVHAPPAPIAPTEPGPKPQACECGAAAEYVYVLHSEIHAYEKAWAPVKSDGSWEPVDLSKLLDFNDLDEMPDRAQWRFSCDAHVPVEQNPYGFRVPKDWAGWMRKSAHLIDSKSWIKSTNYGATLAVLAGWD